MTTEQQLAAIRELDALHAIASILGTRLAWSEYWWRRFELAVLLRIPIGEHWPAEIEPPCRDR